MKRYKSYFEAKQVGIIYHFTPYENLISIIKDDALMIKNHNYLSFTRDKNANKSRLKLQCKIVLDGDKLSNKYKIEPFDYFNSEYNKQHPIGYSGQDEQEERIKIRILKDLHKYVKEIIISYNPDVFNYIGKEWDFLFNEYLREISELNKKKFKIKIKVVGFTPDFSKPKKSINDMEV